MTRKAKGLDDGIKRWETFHKKPHRKLIKTKLVWPKKWGRLGEAETTYYQSGKWYKNKVVRYYHDHSAGVVCYHPLGYCDGLTPEKPPVVEWPETGAILGNFLGWDVQPSDGKLARKGELLEAEPDSAGSLLCASPDGHLLFVVEHGKITGLLVGKSLKVEAEGIDG